MTSTYNTRQLEPPSQAPQLGSELFNLKVMRFPQPSLKTNANVIGMLNEGELLADERAAEGHTYHTCDSISSALGLVSERKKVYLGENSRMCVIITHNSNYAVSSVGVRIEVQTQKSRQILVDSMQSPRDLNAGQTFDYFLDFKLTDPGENALVCCVFYRDEDNQIKNFQKFFRFAVDEPFRVDTKLIGELGGSDTCMLAQIALTNLSADNILIEDLSFGSKGSVVASEVKPDGTAPKTSLVKPQSVQCFGFRLNSSDQKDKRRGGELGSIEIRWRRAGHVGVLRTKSLHLPDNQKHPRCTLRAVGAPGSVFLESVFHVTLEVECFSPKPVHVRLSMTSHKHLSIIAAGRADLSCGVLSQGQKKRIKIALMPLALGIQRIAGFKLKCPNIGWSADYDNLHQVCVMKHGATAEEKKAE
mmetsp:Transcript_27277/g.52889  ORF Transcript_27277/g.52889 Transcript_27277/m.52889 type:complete len:417 (-) Transcript_27277:181-1431(-)